MTPRKSGWRRGLRVWSSHYAAIIATVSLVVSALSLNWTVSNGRKLASVTQAEKRTAAVAALSEAFSALARHQGEAYQAVGRMRSARPYVRCADRPALDDFAKQLLGGLGFTYKQEDELQQHLKEIWPNLPEGRHASPEYLEALKAQSLNIQSALAILEPPMQSGIDRVLHDLSTTPIACPDDPKAP